MDEQLIETIRSYEELYNHGNKLYFDNVQRNKRWREIGEKLNKTVDECKQRWESLRSQFRKICKIRETKTGQAATKRKKWRYEDEMSFLLPYIKDKQRVSSLDTDTAYNDSDINEEEQQSEELQDENELRNGKAERNTSQNISPEASPALNTPSTSRIKKIPRKRNQHPSETASATLMKYIISEKQKEAETEIEKKDHIDLFFDSIKATVRTFSPVDYQHVKRSIFHIVSETESKYLLPTNVNNQPYQQQLSYENLPSNSSFGSRVEAPTLYTSSDSRPVSNASSYFENFSPDTI